MTYNKTVEPINYPAGKELLIKLDFLLNNTNIGFYNKCEIIEIFGYNKDKKEAFNIYTLLVFENTQQNIIKELMTNKLQKFNGYKNLSWGIQRRVVQIDIIRKLYIELLENNKYEIDDPLKIGKLKFLEEKYLPPVESSNKKIQLNNVVKNNFSNGSYLLEFFDEEKEYIKFLLDDPALLNEFSEQVSNILPIKIGTVSDRLGNIVFQFPINSFHLSFDSIVDITKNKPIFQGFKFKIYPIKNFDIKNLLIKIYEEDSEKLITKHSIIEVTENIINILLNDSFGTYIEIMDKRSKLIIYKYQAFIIKHMNIKMNVAEHQNRIFSIKKEKQEPIQVSTMASNSIIGKNKVKAHNEWISNRVYEEELKELEKSKAFIQYFANEEEKALSDVQYLINKYGEQGVYIWDPYLSAIDIKNTLYHSKMTNVPMKSITGLQQGSKKLEIFFKDSRFLIETNKPKRYICLDFQYKLIKFQQLSKRQKAKVDMINEFEEDKKDFLFLDLEVRGKIGSSGYNFHDRFLIFPGEKVKVWSLGISVNQLGKSHHILQEVKNAQHILNAFDKLWDELNHEECLVWKSK
jgi:hypothetical protein